MTFRTFRHFTSSLLILFYHIITDLVTFDIGFRLDCVSMCYLVNVRSALVAKIVASHSAHTGHGGQCQILEVWTDFPHIKPALQVYLT